MNDGDALALHVQLTAEWPPARGQVVIASYDLDRGDRLERRDGLRAVHVARMDDHIDPSKDLENPVWEVV